MQTILRSADFSQRNDGPKEETQRLCLIAWEAPERADNAEAPYEYEVIFGTVEELMARLREVAETNVNGLSDSGHPVVVLSEALHRLVGTILVARSLAACMPGIKNGLFGEGEQPAPVLN